MSHLWAAQRLGMKTHGFILLPFIGGLAFIGGTYKSHKHNVIVSLAGPLGGSLFAALTAVLYQLTGLLILKETVVLMSILNIFNMLPLAFLDGGQVFNCIGSSIDKRLGFYHLIFTSVVIVFFLWKINVILAVAIILLSSLRILDDYSNIFKKKKVFVALTLSEIFQTLLAWLFIYYLLLFLLLTFI
jgi:Zn-dependent protease